MTCKPSAYTSEKPASLLFSATIASTIIGIFLGIYFYISSDPMTSIRITTFFIVGVIGILSFLRHSVFYKSDQMRMGWMQENPQFQIEVGFANLAIGLAGFAAAVLWWGPLACGMTLLTFGIYMASVLLLHIRESFVDSSKRKSATKKIANTAIFTLSLLGFAAFAFMQAGVLL